MSRITADRLAAQEARFAHAFASGVLEIARPLYHPDVVYVSPTVRVYGWPARIEGIDRTLEFIALTISNCRAIRYEAIDRAIASRGDAAFVRVRFDWSTPEGRRLRSTYVTFYRYRDAQIVRQELYYDPSGALEKLGER